MADLAEFDAFVVACSPRLLRTAYLLVGERHLAQDLVQTALAKSWFAWKRIQGNPEPYVRKVMVTTATSWWQRRWHGEVPTETILEEGRADSSSDDRVDVWRAIEHLPPRQRAVVVLRFYEDLTERQVADVLGCSVGTVKSQCAKALAKLRVDDVVVATADEGRRSR
jgi:RNA polymerase sigma-70 factor (sigma-E family)